MTRIWTRRLLVAGALGLFAGALGSACDATTAGDTVEFELGAVGVTDGGAPDEPFTTARGWVVTLREAKLAVGPVYLYGEAALSDETAWLGAPWVHDAQACTTDAQNDRGAVVGEVLAQYPVDLLAPGGTSLGRTVAEAGRSRLMELHLHEPGWLAAGAPFDGFGDHSVKLRGAAEKGGETIDFAADLDIPDIDVWRIVQDIPTDVDLAHLSASGGRAVIQVHLDRVFDDVDFAALPEAADGEPRRFEADEQSAAYQALVVYGLRWREAYSLTWEGP